MSRVPRLLQPEHVLLLLLPFVPVALGLEYLVRDAPLWIFLTSSIAIVPLAGLMGRATEHLSTHVGPGLGGLVNATFGNAAEIIIAVIALRAGLHDLVKASLTGSIIGNVLLVFGLAALAGGVRYRSLRFNKTAATLGSTMLLLSTAALVLPAVFHLTAGEDARLSEQRMSLLIALVLLATYGLSLLFSLKTHAHLYGSGGGHAAGPPAVGTWSIRRSLGVLLGSAAVVAFMSELLVGSVEAAAHAVGMNEVFVGVILVAVVGNAAEHSTAILVAVKNKMDLSINIAVGSSVQIALFAAPLLVLSSYAIGPTPMDLLFTPLEIIAVAIAVAAITVIAHDGETHWMEGVQLVAIYLLIGTSFFFFR
jgi:Ca2+:H+ antiporter